MNNRERVVIYCLLGALLAINVSHLAGRVGRPAFAEPLAGPGTDLGPAEALILRQAEAEKDVVLRNRGGRLAWGEAAHDRAYSTAFIYIGTVLNRLMESAAFLEDREQLMKELEAEEADHRAQLDGISERLREMDPESEEAQRTYEEGAAVYQEYMKWQQAATQRRGTMDAEHLERAYREMIEAVQIVADRHDIDTVYRFIPTDEPFNADNPEQAMLAIRLRTALRYPKELDMTDDVAEELGLE